jgi:hypothetical protein
MKNERKDMRVFGIAMAVVLGAIGIWQFVAGRSVAGTVLVSIAAAFLAAALLVPPVLRPLYVPWRWFGFVMGFFMTRVILTVFYFLVITPFAVVRRLLGKDSLERSLDRDAATWWLERDGEPPPRERYERQF